MTTTENKPAGILKHTPGPWREGKNYGAVVSDSPIDGGVPGSDDIESYGGYLICESVAKCNNPIIAAAPGMLATLKRSAQEHLDMAALLDTWARESVEGSWSTHQVDAQRRRADQCRKHAADALAAIAKAERAA